ncbi:hypothetical protein JNMOADIG_00099 [Aeromonas phage avDM5]|uniref:Putative endonuclease SegE-like GIY-YIG domain-containing protein n=1 Tax=Aeromonas phage vB_AehM_DM2 TaxID=2973716 RepID=A0AA95C493_9CAUD|nr:hypothetical protein JNMOADIG_00099 [Aeromonas phage avDM5]UYD60398.1 hypothetical protein NPHMPGLK_00063 [Aeromonas phage avDM2]UYD60766.1 hypothetical protein NHNEHLNL_00170 [Aeromonas phage avDM2]
MTDYGHWSVLKEVDTREYLGFVYVITFEDGKKYIGAKKLWKRIKAAPATFKRGPKNGFEESDWKSYTSSSNELNRLISAGINPCEYLIVGWYPTWGKTLMAEMEMQLANDVLRDPKWLNRQIGGQFNPNCFDDLTSDDIARYLAFEKGNEHTSWQTMYKIGQKTKYVHPDDVERHIENGWQIGRSIAEKNSSVYVCSKYTLWDYCENKEVVVVNQSKFAKDNGIQASHLSKVLSGDMDLAGKRYGLPAPIARQRFKYRVVETGDLILSDKDIESYFNVPRGSKNRLIKEGKLEKLTVESQQEYKERLATIDLICKTRIEKVSIIKENSFKDITNNLSAQEKADLSKWLKDYLTYLQE